jgi:hypothetical protein
MMRCRGVCAYPMVQTIKNEMILVDAPERPSTMLEFVQSRQKEAVSEKSLQSQGVQKTSPK